MRHLFLLLVAGTVTISLGGRLVWAQNAGAVAQDAEPDTEKKAKGEKKDLSPEPDGAQTEQPAVSLQEAAEIQAAAIQAAAVQAGPKALSRAFRLAARHATPAVVVISVYGQSDEPAPRPDPSDDSGQLPLLRKAETPDKIPPTRQTGLGSGVIVSRDGLVITNNHVIARAKKVEVQLSDGTKHVATKFLGDPESDVAVLRIESDEPFPMIETGDSDSLEIGDWVLAIGSPFRLEATVSAGIISAKNRKLERVKRSRLLQTDAAINPGNSGGPLIDLDGKIVGVNTAIATRSGFYQGVGFAIPINQAKWIVDELDQHGRVRRASMGTTLVELNPKNAKLFKLPTGLGILVYQIIKGSAADKAGMKQLDVILEFAGQRVRDPNSLSEEIERAPIGSIQDVKVQRDGKEIMLRVEMAPVEDPTAGKSPPKSDGEEKKEASAPESE